MFTVYRAVDGEGQVLYVGATHDLESRKYQHRPTPWFGQVASFEVESRHETREQALAAESAAICRYDPPHNHQPGTRHELLCDGPRCSRVRQETDKRRARTICVRFSAAEVAEIEVAARASGLIHVSEEPDWSKTVRRLVAEAIRARKPD